MTYLPFGRDEGNLFLNVVAKRYGRGSMEPRQQSVLHPVATALADDQILTAALLDRLLHHEHIVQISDDRYRVKDRRKAGALRRGEREVLSGV